MKILTDKADFSKENAVLKNYQQVQFISLALCPKMCSHGSLTQAFSELQLQNAELRRRLEDAHLCKNNFNISNSLPALQTTQRLEEKQDINNINMSLKLDLEGVKLDLDGVKLEALDGSVKMIPEVMDDLLAVTWLVHLVMVIFDRLTVRHRMVRSVTLCHPVNLTMLLGNLEGSSRRKGCIRKGFP